MTKKIVFQLVHQDIGITKMVRNFLKNSKKILELRFENSIELHVKEVKKRGTRKETENSGYKLAGFDHFKSEVLTELK